MMGSSNTWTKAVYLFAAVLTTYTNGVSISVCERVQSRLNCSGRGLTSIPIDLPTDVVYLHLENNLLSGIPSGVFDDLTAVLELHLGSNLIEQIDEGVWDAQLSRSAAVSRLLWLDMDGNPSRCNLTSDASNIFCHCAENFRIGPLSSEGRLYCGSESPTTSRPTPAPTTSEPTQTQSSGPTSLPTISPSNPTQPPSTFNPTQPPTISNPTEVPSTSNPTVPEPTESPTSTAPTTKEPTSSPTLMTTFWDNSFNRLNESRGCCASDRGEQYDWYLYDDKSLQDCQQLCESESTCRGIEYPWSTIILHFRKCYLLFDSGVSPTHNQDFLDSLTGGDGIGPISSASVTCSRSFNNCYRRCIPILSGPNLCPQGDQGVIIPLVGASLEVVPADRVSIQFDREITNLPVSLEISPTGQFAIEALDSSAFLYAPFTLFDIEMRGIICGTRYLIPGVVPGPSCQSLIEITVLDIYAAPPDFELSTVINFFATFNGTVISGEGIVMAVQSYSSGELSQLFVASVISVSSPVRITTSTTTTSITAADVSFQLEEPKEDILPLLLVILASVLVVVALVMAIVYLYGRVVALNISISTVRDRIAGEPIDLASKEKLLRPDSPASEPEDTPQSVVNPMAKFYANSRPVNNSNKPSPQQPDGILINNSFQQYSSIKPVQKETPPRMKHNLSNLADAEPYESFLQETSFGATEYKLSLQHAEGESRWG